MNKSERDAVAKRAVEGIIEDLSDRRGLRQMWESIDDETQAKIVAVWIAIVSKAIDEEPSA